MCSRKRNAWASLIARYIFFLLSSIIIIFSFCNKQHIFPDTLGLGDLACPLLCISNQFSSGYWSQKKLSSLLKPYPQCTLAFFKLISLLIKCLSTNSSKVFPNHWLSFVIPTTQKWHPRTKQSFACLRNLKEVCPRFILLFDALKQNYFKVFLSVKRLFCRSYIRSCNCNLIILLLSFLKKVLLIQLYKKTQQNRKKKHQKKHRFFPVTQKYLAVLKKMKRKTFHYNQPVLGCYNMARQCWHWGLGTALALPLFVGCRINTDQFQGSLTSRRVLIISTKWGTEQNT